MEMRIGIVGAEKIKFTDETEKEARSIIRAFLHDADVVVSGGCHLGGIDIWAVEEARAMGFTPDRIIEHLPERLTWSPGYKERNLKIARDSDLVVSITVKNLPPGFAGMKFPQGCYHCNTRPESHVKSGGCWTAKQAKRMGKQARLIVIE